MSRADQLALLRWTLRAIDGDPGPLPELDAGRLQVAGTATGLTAVIGALADRHRVELPGEWESFVGAQREAVCWRAARFREALPRVLGILHAAEVMAIPVKGAVLADSVWPVPGTRPMADLDLIVAPGDRRRAVDALVAADVVLERSDRDEDTFLLWGDGSAGVTDRESVGHSGRLEIHPGWSERFHGYSVDDGGWLLESAAPGMVADVACGVLSPPAVAAHTLGHLSSGVVRGVVRALNIVDVAVLLRRLDERGLAELGAICDLLDPRLVAPGWWVLSQLGETRRPAEAELAERQLARLAATAREALRSAPVESTLRESGARTTTRWRLAFPASPIERVAVLRQAALPARAELARDAPGEPTWKLHAARGRRAIRRLLRQHPSVDGRVVYVLAGDPGDVSASGQLDAAPTARRTVAELRAAGVAMVGVARTRSTDHHLTIDGAEWRFVADRSRAAWRLAGLVASLRPAVVHLNGIGFAATALAVRLRCGRVVRVVVQHHGEPPGKGVSRVAQRLARRAVDAYLFTGGAAQAGPFVEAGVLAPTTPVCDVMESSADLVAIERTTARAATGLSGEPAVIAVGRLVEGKDPLTVVRAFATAAAALPTAELWWLYGDAEQLGLVRAEIAQHGAVAKRIHLVGRVDHAEVATWLSAADVFVSASRREGSGYALIEAIRCGCTPVVSDLASHRSIVGELGARFPVGDVGAAAAALAGVTPDRGAATQHFATALGWDTVVGQLIGAYQVALPATAPSSGRS